MTSAAPLLDRLSTLENERLDTSYLDHGRQARRNAIDVQARAQLISEEMLKARLAEAMKKRKKLDDARIERVKKLYFNAGRFAAGATDDVALKCHEIVMGADEL
jgi:hypothetical protein